MKRISEHRLGLLPGFTQQYDIKRLVWMEPFADIGPAIAREKQIKKWNRAWKIRLIEEAYPCWDDLAETMLGFEPLLVLDAATASDGFPPSRE